MVAAHLGVCGAGVAGCGKYDCSLAHRACAEEGAVQRLYRAVLGGAVCVVDAGVLLWLLGDVCADQLCDTGGAGGWGSSQSGGVSIDHSKCCKVSVSQSPAARIDVYADELVFLVASFPVTWEINSAGST